MAAFSSDPAQVGSFERLQNAAKAADQLLLSSLMTSPRVWLRLRDPSSFPTSQQNLSLTLKI